MATAADKLQILVIQHLEHVGVGEDVMTALKAALENSKKAEGSTLYELFCSATGEGLTPQQQQQQQQQGRRAPQQQQQIQSQRTLLPSQIGGSQQAAMMQQQPVPESKPVIAKEPEERNMKLDDQLMQAAKAGNADAIPGYIKAGAYVNMQDGSGTTPLLAATQADKADVVKVLLQNGADVNLARPDGTSPLLCAYKGNKKTVLKELTAGAFRTLNCAVHQTGNIGVNTYYDHGEDEGVTEMDVCQLRDEYGSLFKLQAEPAKVSPTHKPVVREESMVNIGGPGDISDLRQGGVKLLMQELCQVTQKPA